MSANEWRDLPTMADVAAAKAAGDEIQVHHIGSVWNSWKGVSWANDWIFRARPAQPKMKKVKLLCWYDGTWLQWANESHSEVVAYTTKWKRVPAEDKEIEVPE